jgi:DNA-binding CsgD family transcriptional regulator
VVPVEGTAQRPLERRVLSWLESGLDPSEVAARFRRSPEFIDRVAVLARLPREAVGRVHSELRPLERRVLRWREQGASFEEIAARFRRTPEFIERVVDMTRLGPRQGR